MDNQKQLDEAVAKAISKIRQLGFVIFLIFLLCLLPWIFKSQNDRRND